MQGIAENLMYAEGKTFGAVYVIVGICGSPRQESTEYITKKLWYAEEKGFETKFFTVRGKQIHSVHIVTSVYHRKGSTFKDAMEEVYALLKKHRNNPCQRLLTAQ